MNLVIYVWSGQPLRSFRVPLNRRTPSFWAFPLPLYKGGGFGLRRPSICPLSAANSQTASRRDKCDHLSVCLSVSLSLCRVERDFVDISVGLTLKVGCGARPRLAAAAAVAPAAAAVPVAEDSVEGRRRLSSQTHQRRRRCIIIIVITTVIIPSSSSSNNNNNGASRFCTGPTANTI